jgi:hypothetical protein
VAANSAEEINSPGFAAAHGMVSGWWLDRPYPDEDEAGYWWVMPRVSVPDVEGRLQRLSDLKPEVLGWRKADEEALE